MSEEKKSETAPAANSGQPAQGRPDSRGPGGFRGPGGPGGDRRNQRRGPRRDDRKEGDGPELEEKVVFINRCAKATKGGRSFSFSALVVSGDKKGKVGFGFGKANEVADCIRKASEASKKVLAKMEIVNGTIPHEVYAEFGGAKVLLKPACPGTGIIAGGSVRAVCEAVGITDILGKSLGSKNHANLVKGTLKALGSLKTKDQIYSARGKKTAKQESMKSADAVTTEETAKA